MSHRRSFQHGLIVGKFYPPHAGHEYLIRTALHHCRRVSVLVLASSRETLPMAARVRWIRECFADAPALRVQAELDDVPIDYADPTIWDEHVAIMRQGLAHADAHEGEPAGPVDAVFTSEAYGAELARRFGAANVCLDPARALFPISGTNARHDTLASWELLPPAVRAGLALRVVVLGAESTGTTTLARDLCAALRARGGVWERTAWVPEYGREYSANLLAVLRATHPEASAFDLEWLEPDFLHIAREQTRREANAAAHGGPVLVCDTDALATCVWHERYRRCSSPALSDFAAQLPPRGLYLLTDQAGVPFEDDGLRDGEHLRPWMTERFAEVLEAQSTPWSLVRGTPRERLSSALHLVDSALRERLSFAAPLRSR